MLKLGKYDFPHGRCLESWFPSYKKDTDLGPYQVKGEVILSLKFSLLNRNLSRETQVTDVGVGW